jgi:lysophospholipase L1-like esterase
MHLMRDSLHPSPIGYRIWAQAIEPDLAAMPGEMPVTP